MILNLFKIYTMVIEIKSSKKVTITNPTVIPDTIKIDISNQSKIDSVIVPKK